MHDADIRSEDAQFLAGYDASEFERPSVAVDVALLTVHEGGLRVLLVERVEPPQRGAWALPGGFVGMNESLDDAAARVLRDKGGLEGNFLEQLYSFGSLGRDPRTRVISVAYVALVDHARLEATGRPLAELQVPWEGEEGGPVEVEGMDLAFDHAEILGAAVKRLRGKLDYAALGFQLLPDRFTLRDLPTVHETILGRELNKDSFRRRMHATGLIEPTGEREQNVLHRPAELYRIHQASAV